MSLRPAFRFCIGAAAALSMGACSVSFRVPPEPAKKTAGHQHAQKHWSYHHDESGPPGWGSLNPAFSLCSAGKNQSPVDLSSKADLPLTPLAFSYKPSAFSLKNNGHTIQADFAPENVLRVGSESYNLLQFHFHGPSEHTIQGRSFPMELHLVHADQTGHLAVAGIMIEEGPENKALKPVFDSLPLSAGDSPKTISAPLDPALILPAELTYYEYPGSLTTPPCSEGVRWIVLKEPISLSADQITAFKKLIGTSNRPLQKLNGRIVLSGIN